MLTLQNQKGKILVAESGDINTLEEMLKSHVWYYSYSDDYKVWKRGEEHHKIIMGLVKQLGGEGKKIYTTNIKKI
jgi:hypothetical protein|tara:strand:+ start:446 stop:670 length:225 start_codon:yes stop_codon:yes gene_type:complete